jgi:two-component sensor histidine kinase
LILAQQLYENAEGNLNDKQIRYAKTIHSCGDDLIQLINDILDLSKIESGFISANISSVRISEIASFVETTFKPIPEARNLKFRIETDYELPAVMETDIQRLNQILKNLLSNAFKFTEKGEVALSIFEASKNWKPGVLSLDTAPTVIGFSISDTGIGIPLEKQSIIFEAFQQAEGSTSRKYGGTGLGLSISRGLAELLGGTIELESEAGRGSTFTLYLPLNSSVALGPREVSESMKVIQQLRLDADGNQIATPLLSHKNNVKNFVQTGITSTNGVTVSNSNDVLNYRLSYSNMVNKGIIPNSDLFKNALSLNTAVKIAPKFTLSSNLDFSRSNSNNRPASNRGAKPLQWAYAVSPHIDIRDLRNYWVPGQEGLQQFTQDNGAGECGREDPRLRRRHRRFDRAAGHHAGAAAPDARGCEVRRLVA